MGHPDVEPSHGASPLTLVSWLPAPRERHLLEAIARVHAEHEEAGALLAAVHAVERAVTGAAAAVFHVDPDAQVVSLRAAGPRWRTAERESPALLTREASGISGFARGAATCGGRWWRQPGASSAETGIDIARVRVMRGDELWGMLVVVRPAGDDDRGEDAWFIESLSLQLGLALDHLAERADLQRAVEDARQSQVRAQSDERLVMLGQLATGVSHDFNNTLTTILGVAEWLLLSRTDDAELTRDLESVRDAALHAAARVRRLQYLGKRRNAVPREVAALDDIARLAVEQAQATLADDERLRARPVQFTVACEDDVDVEVDPAAMREVFVNLLWNAVEASPDGGTITVRVGREGTHAYAAVEDHGIGMDDLTRARACEPFFSTKPSRGAGLGLALCTSIVESHDGRLDVASTRHVGSTFTVWLPADASSRRVAPVASRPRVVPPLPAPVARTVVRRSAPVADTAPLILVVDDQADVRASVAEMLTALGYRTREAASGPEALRQAEDEDFDLVVTDLGMPGMNGLDLAQALRREQPELPVLLLTGWGSQYDGRPPGGIARVLAKPVTLDTLDSVVAGVIDGRTRTGA